MITFFKRMVRVIAFLQIAVAPLLIGAISGLGIYSFFPQTIGLLLEVLFTLIGLVMGIVWAFRVDRKSGVVEYMSRVIASPELDHTED